LEDAGVARASGVLSLDDLAVEDEALPFELEADARLRHDRRRVVWAFAHEGRLQVSIDGILA